jgi:hypothetical protein
MLATTYQDSLKSLLETAHCEVELPADWHDLFSRRGPIPSSPLAVRRFNRAYFPTRSALQCYDPLPAIPRGLEVYCIYTKDLSRDGIGFFHCTPLYPGEVVRLWLPNHWADYTIVRCVRHSDRCFEIGGLLKDVIQ